MCVCDLFACVYMRGTMVYCKSLHRTWLGRNLRVQSLARNSHPSIWWHTQSCLTLAFENEYSCSVPLTRHFLSSSCSLFDSTLKVKGIVFGFTDDEWVSELSKHNNCISCEIGADLLFATFDNNYAVLTSLIYDMKCALVTSRWNCSNETCNIKILTFAMQKRRTKKVSIQWNTWA